MPVELPLATGALTRISYVTNRLRRLSLRANLSSVEWSSGVE
jgi:hypothetical protein